MNGQTMTTLCVEFTTSSCDDFALSHLTNNNHEKVPLDGAITKVTTNRFQIRRQQSFGTAILEWCRVPITLKHFTRLGNTTTWASTQVYKDRSLLRNLL